MPPKKVAPDSKAKKATTAPKPKVVKEASQSPEEETKSHELDELEDEDLESDLLEEFDEDLQDLEVDPEEQEAHQSLETDQVEEKAVVDADDEEEAPKKKVPQRRIVTLDNIGGDDDEFEPDPDDFDIIDDEEDDDTQVVKNTKTIKFVPDNERTSSEILGSKECGRVLGDYAEILNKGAPPFIDTSNCTSSLEIAYLSLMQRKIPFCIIRYRNANEAERWRLKEMVLNDIPPLDWFVPRAR